MEENKFIAFFSKHWSKILLGLVAIACLGIWAERQAGERKSQSKLDYVTGNQLFEKFQKGEPISVEIAQTVLKRHPELHPKFDTLLALSLFSQAKFEEALPYATAATAQAKKHLPSLYQEYAAATLLISKGEYKEAYQSALDLFKQLNGEAEYQTLEAMNTLRLVFLAQKLGEEGQKIAFWKKLQAHPGYLSLEALFREGNISLADYFKAR